MRQLVYLIMACLTLEAARAETLYLTDFEGRDGSARIEIQGNGTGQIRMTLSLVETLADIRGVFFDLDGEFENFSVTGDPVTAWYAEDFSLDQTGIDPGNLALFGPVGSDVNLGGTRTGLGFAVELGSPGIGTDDIRTAEVLLSNAYDLQLGEIMGMRLMSVGESRDGSRKLLGDKETPSPVPEPATIALLGMGLLCMGNLTRRLVSKP